jgi:Bacterial TniB protein
MKSRGPRGLPANLWQARRGEVARWGLISPSLAKHLAANNPREIAKVSLFPFSTARSFALSLLEVFEKPEPGKVMRTSQMWTTIHSHLRRKHFRLLIVDGIEHLGGTGEGDRRRGYRDVCDALKSLLHQGISFACIGSGTGARFLLEDFQLSRPYVGQLG